MGIRSRKYGADGQKGSTQLEGIYLGEGGNTEQRKKVEQEEPKPIQKTSPSMRLERWSRALLLSSAL